MVRTVQFEGKKIPSTKLPEGSLFIQGCWYSSADKLPENLKAKYGRVFYEIAKQKANSNIAPDTSCPDVDILSELQRTFKMKQKIGEFWDCFLKHMDGGRAGNDKKSVTLFLQKCMKRFGLPFQSLAKLVEEVRDIREYQTRLAGALIESTSHIEKGKSSITFHFKTKKNKLVRLPRNEIDGFWRSQEEYAERCVKRGEAKDVEKMLDILRGDREEGRDKMTWGKTLTSEGYEWGMDAAERYLRKTN